MLKPEEMIIGRRNFMKAAAVLPAVAAYTYAATQAKPIEAAIIGTGNEGRVLLGAADPSYIQIRAMCDLRPDHRMLGEYVIKGDKETKGKWDPEKVRVYKDVDQMLSDGGFEAVLIATPLHTHAPLTIKCLEAGMHVLCEKTMAYTVEECDKMIETSEKQGKILAIGHQRHANPLYQTAKAWMKEGKEGTLGEVHHIRSLWHRNNDWRNMPLWDNDVLVEAWGGDDPKTGKKVSTLLMELPNIEKGIKPKDFKEMKASDQIALWFKFMQQKDPTFDYKALGYDTPDQMANWRLYSKFSHGLMSELGSHQIDVCNWMWEEAPETVCGVGGIYFYKDERDVPDHAFCTFKYPDNRVMVFSSITTNDFDGYYDQIMGKNGTVFLTAESEGMLYKTGSPKTTEINVEEGKSGKSSLTVHKTLLGSAKGSGLDAIDPYSPYGEEIKMFGEAIRKGDPSLVGCDGQAGRRAAIAVFTANKAMATNSVLPINVGKTVA
jgi:predicted dehydrogenase